MDYIPDWIERYLSEREIREMEFFFTDLRRTSYRNSYKDYDSWNEIKGKEGIRDRIREVKDMCDGALRLNDEDPRKFLSQWDKLREKTTSDGHPGIEERVFSCAHDAYLGADVRPSLWADNFDGTPDIFRKVDGRRNPNWKRKVSRQEVVEKAESLLDEQGAKAYPTRRGADHQKQFLKDVGEELNVHWSTVKTHLEESNWRMPDECYIAKRKAGLN